MNSIYSFPPVADAGAERLILGSMPGKVSLSEQQYYAHPRNLFWRFMSSVEGVPEALSYEQRCRALVDRHIALWDVLKTCVRSSSLDADIDEASIIPNDFKTFLSAHPGIRCIYFNGAKAQASYLRYVQPQLPPHLAAIEKRRLPSTSPANAAMSLAVKLAQWQAITHTV
tara:strand:- start:261 stop:770 length:510 start_codon:yes stop_codon:yes gene_type:complete